MKAVMATMTRAATPAQPRRQPLAALCNLRASLLRASRAVLPLALMLSAANVQAQEAEATPAPGVLIDRIVAIVNDGVVLHSELQGQVQMVTARLRAQNTPLPAREIIEEQILERLIVARIQLQRAERLGIRMDDDTLNRALTAVAERNKISFNDLPAALESQGIGYGEYREEMRREMILEQLRARDVTARIQIPQAEVDRRMREQEGRDESIEYRLQHILIATPSSARAEDIAEARTQAADLVQRLRDGEDFSRMAVAYSAGQTALSGGDLGWMRTSEMPTLFVNVAISLSEGEVSEALESPSGYHIVKLAETRGADKVIVQQRHVRHILIKPNEVVTLEQARQRAADLRQQILDGEDFAELAKEHSEDGGSANAGGDLDWTNPGTFVPPFEAALAELRPGAISEPVRSEFGWHVIELLGTRDYDSTDDVQRNKVFMAIRREKQEIETERWLRQLRDEAFVEVRL